jgi:ferredoxin
MTQLHKIKIHDRQTDTYHTFQVPEDRYILQSVKIKAARFPLPAAMALVPLVPCAFYQDKFTNPEAIGLSQKLRDQGYALLCVSYPRSDLAVESQDEDEVYELQFGRYFARGRVRFGLPLDEE